MHLHSTIKLVGASVLALSMASAFAASSTDLKVTGKITTAACSVQAGLGGNLIVFDDRIPNPDPSGFTPLFKANTNSVEVKCPSPTSVKLRIVDNHASAKPGVAMPFKNDDGSQRFTLDPSHYYGLIDSNTGQSVGAFTIAVLPGFADSKLGYPIAQSTDGQNWDVPLIFPGSPLADSYINGSLPYLTMVTTRFSDTPVSASYFQFGITAAATLSPNTHTQNIALDGSVTVEVTTI